MNLVAQIQEIMNTIDYGYVDKDDIKHNIIDNTFASLYKLQSPEALLKSKLGVCWDQVELERMLFTKQKIDCETYFIVYFDNNKCPTHTFLVYQENNQFVWFEHSWEKYQGIHKYNSIEELLIDVRHKLIIDEVDGEIDYQDLCIYKYNKPKYNISCLDFYKHCEKSINIIL